MKKYIKADNGKVSQVLAFDSGNCIEMPLNKDGSIKWLEESVKSLKKNINEEKNGIIEAIKAANGRVDITDTEWCLGINGYEYASFSISTSDKQPFIRMNVNHYEETADTHKFSYICNDTETAMYQFRKEDVVSVSAEYDKEKGTVLIICSLVNDMEACFDIHQSLLKTEQKNNFLKREV